METDVTAVIAELREDAICALTAGLYSPQADCPIASYALDPELLFLAGQLELPVAVAFHWIRRVRRTRSERRAAA